MILKIFKFNWINIVTYFANFSYSYSIKINHHISWLINHGFDDVDAEVDSHNVVLSMRSSDENQTEFGSVILDCKSLLQQGSNYCISWVSRQVNRTTHAIFKGALAFDSHFL